jgi:hypothetical protein
MASVARLGRSKPYVLAALASLFLWDLTEMNTASGLNDLALPYTVLLGAFVSALVLYALQAEAWRTVVERWRTVLPLALLIIAAGLTIVQDYRDKTRYEYFGNGIDLHDFPRGSVEGWQVADEPDAPRVIAFATGWLHPGHNWFLYPLLGRRLQNHVVYVPTTASGLSGSYVPALTGAPLADPAVWIGRLRAASVDVLFISGPAPPELRWVQVNQDAFRLRDSGNAYRIYDIEYRTER